MTTKTILEYEETISSMRLKLELSAQSEVSLEHTIGEMRKVNQALIDRVEQLSQQLKHREPIWV